MLQIDGSRGEGGGQTLRTCLSLSALTGRPFQIENIRAKRSRPGLRPQHLAAVRAIADICDAQTVGARLDSTTLEFRPKTEPRGGDYHFDVVDTSRGGSAGSAALILQAILWPLMFADKPSQVMIAGGTHVPFSPPFHYLDKVFRPAIARVGASVDLQLLDWGWYPQGGGRIVVSIDTLQGMEGSAFATSPIEVVEGIAAVTNLPSHIPQRMADRAHNLLSTAGIRPVIETLRGRGHGPGAMLMLWSANAGFMGLGRKGLPAEKIADATAESLMAFAKSRAAVDPFLSDQLLLPMSLAHGRSTFTTQELTKHSMTNMSLLREWLGVQIKVDESAGLPAAVTIDGIGFSRRN